MRLDRFHFVPGLLLATSVFAHEGTPSRFNYYEHVRPIFVEHCGGCHRQGGAAPMSLLEYSEAVPWANATKMQVLEQRMPPWLPSEETGSFRHARSLSAEEIDILIDWAVGQTPEGEPMTAEETANPTAGGWSVGEPDLVLSPESNVLIGADESEAVRCMVVPTGLKSSRRASAFEIKPGLPTVVRRATVYLGTDCGRGHRPIVTWLSGEGRAELAPDVAVVLEPNADLAVELHYVKGWNEEGSALEDHSELGLWYQADAEPVESLEVTQPSYRFARDITLVALYPEPVGESEEPIRVESVSPEGVVEPLLAIDRYDEQWRERYVLAEPLLLPAGSELRVFQTAVWVDFIASSAATAE
jgi:hypothetical protein